jgi:hypothetical protein
MPRRCDIWRVGIVDRRLPDLLGKGSLDRQVVHWLPEQPSFTFLADPFGLIRSDALYLFAEAYDYRTRHGVIDCLTIDPASFAVRDRRTVLRQPWHLSYPFVFDVDGETWMLPEASRSGSLHLYRARAFPDVWEPVTEIRLDVVPIDATPVRFAGLWWLFYAGGPTRSDRLGTLRIAFASTLLGPWHQHPLNPVLTDMGGARPGGTPFAADGQLIVPVQDCRTTYGGAVRFLRFSRLDPERVTIERGPAIKAPAAFAPYDQGLHTIAQCGPLTLIDAKQVDRTGRGWLIDAARWWRGRATH